jgi:hypothetical protein
MLRTILSHTAGLLRGRNAEVGTDLNPSINVARGPEEGGAAAFIHRFAELFRGVPDHLEAGQILVIGAGISSRVEMEVCLERALELAGWRINVLLIEGTNVEGIRDYYNLLASIRIFPWKNYFHPNAFYDQALSIVHKSPSLKDLISLRVGGVRIGGHAVATLRRQLHSCTLSLEEKAINDRLVGAIAASLASAAGIERLLQEVRPYLVLAEDTAYTPRGQILDVCARNSIPFVSYYLGHKTSALMLKRYTYANRDADVNSLSDKSWRLVREMQWSTTESQRIHRELTEGYIGKTWYNDDGQQFGRRLIDVQSLRSRLELNPLKKTAVIFPHVAWDASFGRGEDLFMSYNEWLIETVQAAISNEELQWVIKIHPSHSGKHGPNDSDEAATLRARFASLPKHLKLIPAESDISTLSLFPAMDYCLTVRGTVGIESACRGIPVLTGGNGGYDGRGFTIDSATPREYLDRVAALHEVPRLTLSQVELAERFAYGIFLLRPLPLSSISIVYDKPSSRENLSNPVHINFRHREDWRRAIDLCAFVRWATTCDDEDFLLPPDTTMTDDPVGQHTGATSF